MAKIKKLLALGLCLCMAAGITVGCGNSKSSKNGTDSGKNTNDGLSFAFCTNTLNNTFQSSIDSKLKELCDKDGISYTLQLLWFQVNCLRLSTCVITFVL